MNWTKQLFWIVFLAALTFPCLASTEVLNPPTDSHIDIRYSPFYSRDAVIRVAGGEKDKGHATMLVEIPLSMLDAKLAASAPAPVTPEKPVAKKSGAPWWWRLLRVIVFWPLTLLGIAVIPVMLGYRQMKAANVREIPKFWKLAAFWQFSSDGDDPAEAAPENEAPPPTD